MACVGDCPLPLDEHRLAWLLTDVPKEVNGVPSRVRNGELIMPESMISVYRQLCDLSVRL